MRTRSKDYPLPEINRNPKQSSTTRKKRQEDRTSASILARLTEPKPPVLSRDSRRLEPWPEGSGPRQIPRDAPPSFRFHRGAGPISQQSAFLTSDSSNLHSSPLSLDSLVSPDDMSGHRDVAPHTVPKWQEPEFLFKIPGMMKTAAPTLSSSGDNYESWKY